MDFLKRDPVEQTAEYLAVIEDINKILESEFPPNKVYLGQCHQYAHRKKELLAACGIQWRSVMEMNKDTTVFD